MGQEFKTGYSSAKPNLRGAKHQVKGKVVSVLNQAPRHEDILREWR